MFWLEKLVAAYARWDYQRKTKQFAKEIDQSPILTKLYNDSVEAARALSETAEKNVETGVQKTYSWSEMQAILIATNDDAFKRKEIVLGMIFADAQTQQAPTEHLLRSMLSRFKSENNQGLTLANP